MCPNGLNELTEDIVNILSHAEIQTVKMEENKMYFPVTQTSVQFPFIVS